VSRKDSPRTKDSLKADNYLGHRLPMLRTNLPGRRLLEMRKTPFMSRVKKNRGRRTPPQGTEGQGIYDSPNSGVERGEQQIPPPPALFLMACS